MKIITISREYGAGGSPIGKEVAKRLGVEIYDKDIIRGIAKVSGREYEDIERISEDLSKKENILRAVTPASYNPTRYLFELQKNVILDLAAKGPCVIIGRCANIILREAGIESLDIFLHADDAHRYLRVSELIGSDKIKDIIKEIKKKDYGRRNFYTSCTGHSWADCRDYHVMLDSGLLGYDTCVEMIVAAAKTI